MKQKKSLMKKKRNPNKLRQQPRIKGVVRVPKHSSLHPDVWEGIREIALYEKRSISWVIAEIVSDYFKIDASTGHVDKSRIRRVK